MVTLSHSEGVLYLRTADIGVVNVMHRPLAKETAVIDIRSRSGEHLASVGYENRAIAAQDAATIAAAIEAEK